MFIQFITERPNNSISNSLGIFAAANDLIEGGTLASFERTEIHQTLEWFNSNLAFPDRFVRSRKPHREDKGVCWFKSSATECMSHVQYLVQLVSDQDAIIRRLTTDKPGFIIYEDDLQVVAEPFATTPQ